MARNTRRPALHRPHLGRLPYQGRRLADAPSLAAYLPRLLLFPLDLRTASSILLFAAMLWLGTQSLLGIPTLGIATLWLLAYLDVLIRQAAGGEIDPPALGGDVLFLANPASFRLLVGPALIASLYFRFHASWPAATTAMLAVSWFLVPAYLLSGSLFGVLAACNPLRLLAVVWTCGPSYLLASAMLTAAGLLIQFVAGRLSVFALLLARIRHQQEGGVALIPYNSIV